MKTYILILLAVLSLSLPAMAQDTEYPEFDGTLRDSVYYTLDDGIMTKSEMEEEARFVHQTCASNLFQNTYMNCECVSGSFLIQREKDGPTVSQTQILENIAQSGKSKCANTEAIAGKVFDECMRDSAVLRETAPDNEGYCTCIANMVASDFAKKPIANPSHVGDLKANATYKCEKKS